MSLKLHLMLFLVVAAGGASAQSVYKWTDAQGQVHYGTKKPPDAANAQALDISTPPASSAASATDEAARLNALSDQMASERQALEKARQEQALRDLEQRNLTLQNKLLQQQVDEQQRQENSAPPPSMGLPFYPEPYLPPPAPSGPPCQPWPACRGGIFPPPSPPPMPPPKPQPPRINSQPLLLPR